MHLRRKQSQIINARNGVEVKATDIFISDGAKSDTGNITELFAKDNVVLVPDPVYPVYVDTNTMDGKNIIYMKRNKRKRFPSNAG